MNALLIKQCTWPGAWYESLVGCTVPWVGLTRPMNMYFISREPTGYCNHVKQCDAEFVYVDDYSKMYQKWKEPEVSVLESAIAWAKKGVDDANRKWEIMKGKKHD